MQEFKTFIIDNKLNDRDTLLLLNENSSQKKIRVVDEFTDIAARITALDATGRIDYSVHDILNGNDEKGGSADE